MSMFSRFRDACKGKLAKFDGPGLFPGNVTPDDRADASYDNFGPTVSREGSGTLHKQTSAEIGAGSRSGGMVTGLTSPDATMIFKNQPKGSPSAVPAAFGAARPNRFDANMNHGEPLRPADGMLGGNGSPSPDNSYGSGAGPNAYFTAQTGGQRAGTAGESVVPQHQPATRHPGAAPSLSDMAARITGLPSPQQPAMPSRGPKALAASPRTAAGLFRRARVEDQR